MGNAVINRPPKFSESEFSEVLNNYLSPSSPVRSEELLQGRSDQLDEIKKALLSPGRNVFIYGDRGVGKTSLAQTAAYLHQPATATPVIVGCDARTTFFSLVREIGLLLTDAHKALSKPRRSFEFEADLAGLASVKVGSSSDKDPIPLPNSVNEATAILQACGKVHSPSPVVVIDEFDRILDPMERSLFGDFLKQIGDLGIPAKFIFCGVGSSLGELLGEHPSCFRYLASVRLERLGLSPLMRIIQTAAEALHVEVEDYYQRRIATISDGFPHYIHLIGAKLFWALFEDPTDVSRVNKDHFNKAVKDSINSVELHLRSSYEKATLKYNDEYQHILWAMSDHPDLIRRSSDVYESHSTILRQLGQTPMERTRFNTRMNALKKATHDRILLGTRQGWYEFREPMIRGYCRLRAEDAGIVLDRSHAFDSHRERPPARLES